MQRAVGFETRPASTATRMAVVVAYEAELDERLAITLPVTAIEAGTDHDHAKFAESIFREPDERGLNEIQCVAVPDEDSSAMSNAPGSALSPR